ncbi:DUF3037 domain-containing protein [Limosilactobacillus fermentum]|uniref:DUF3037 domain-containing protein n=1 Tax=Limosilactobacillus fermentum TaxID=1613 RepID=A0A0R2E5U1_LIMFE|nr:DUF3037 domain-containing protein [Limosilactobacillus fermentum]KRN11810.1 hypothetical protein IV46_GL000998 [Limosilactobacillus fermentum]MCH5389246.1 DUF3037 domain-containing protein [Limosilactobacillus fermentum]MCH5393783.1 DUF3037 domain-containing protein [Limosilactobacillus fermentum]MCT3435890.1 DUF3037 domain-containing protein [Limosilactobacillus fermentum]PPX65475.1 DUF3037 domain-containing protein [Limosilactobacillus fermentum]
MDKQQRKNYWYSIISYIPDLITNERVNIGVILGNNIDLLKFKIIDNPSNKKLHFFRTNIEKQIYQTSIDYLSFIVNKKKETLNDISLFDNESNVDLKAYLEHPLPENIAFSNTHFARTSNPKIIFNELLNTYVGEAFLQEKETTNISFKQNINKYFDQLNLINTKLKANLRIRPSKDLPLRFEMDYAFMPKNNEMSFIQIGPKQSQINEWYKNNVTLLSKNSDKFSINMVIKEEDYEKPNQTFKPFLRDLESDDRVKSTIVTNKDSLSKLVKNAGEAIPISEWNTEDKSYIA